MFGLGLTVKLVPSARRSVMLKAGEEAEAHQQSPLLSYWLNVAGCLLPPLCNPPPSTSVLCDNFLSILSWSQFHGSTLIVF
jgi:hypothetical protein